MLKQVEDLTQADYDAAKVAVDVASRSISMERERIDKLRGEITKCRNAIKVYMDVLAQNKRTIIAYETAEENRNSN